MNEKMSEQAQSALKPMSDLMALNSKILQEAAEKQKDFFTDMINESMSYAKELGSQKDFSGVYQVQKSYMEGVQERILNASTDAYEFFTSVQERAGDVVKSSASK